MPVVDSNTQLLDTSTAEKIQATAIAKLNK